MGACDFQTTAKGRTAQEAFDDARSQACYEHGHGGYTGTIAEKPGFIMALRQPLTPEEANDFVASIDNDDYQFVFLSRYQVDSEQWGRLQELNNDKWGPALCVQIGPEEWFFFGWASS